MLCCSRRCQIIRVHWCNLTILHLTVVSSTLISWLNINSCNEKHWIVKNCDLTWVNFITRQPHPVEETPLICSAFYRPKRSFGQGNIFRSVCHSVHRGGGACSKFGGGACSKFSGGGVPAPNFRGGVPAPNFRGGGSPIFGIRSTFGRYASYWNAFFLYLQRL